MRNTLDTLLLYDPNRSETVTNVWVARPTPNDEQTFGRLILVSAIDTPARSNQDIIALIQDELKTAYYQTKETNIETAFEKALASVNQRLNQLVLEGVKDWIERGHFLAAVVRQQQVIISTAGGMFAYLLRAGRLHDILGQRGPEPINPLRVFGSIVSGHIAAGDRMLFSTPSLLDYFSLEKLRRTLLDHSPSDAVRLLDSSLLGVEYQVAFGAVVMAAESETSTMVSPAATIVRPMGTSTPSASMEQLNAYERATGELLSPSFWLAIRDAGRGAGRIIGRMLRALVLRKPPKRTVPADAIRSVGDSYSRPNARPRWDTLWQRIGVMASRIIGDFRGAARKMRSSAQITKVSYSLAQAPSRPRPLTRFVAWATRLPRRQQAIIGICAVLIVVVIVSLAQTVGPKQSSGSTASKTAALETALSKAQAALLYQGDSAALEQVTLAKGYLNQLPKKSTADKKTIAQYQQQIASIEQRLAHLTTIANPPVILSFATIADFQPQWLFQTTAGFVAIDSTHHLAGIGKSGQTPQSAPNGLDIGTMSSATLLNTTTVLAVTDRLTFVTLDVSKRLWKNVSGQLPSGTSSPQSMAIFQSRLYTLTQGQNPIMRFPVTAAGVGTGANWLKSPSAIDHAVSIAIDGSVYILTDTGVIKKFDAGQPSTFSTATVVPTLNQATKIIADTTLKYIYVLDAEQHRVIEFDKRGALIAQYQSSSWSSLKDVVIDEKGKIGYVLSGTTITSFPLAS